MQLRLGKIALQRGLYEDAVQLCRPVLESTEALAVTRVMAAEELIAALCILDNPSSAVAVAEQASVVAANDAPMAQVFARVCLALAQIGVGDLPSALDAAEEAELLARRSSSYEQIVRSLEVLARVHRHRGDLQASARALDSALEYLGSQSPRSVAIRLDLAAIERQAGNSSRGWTRALEVFRENVEFGRVLHAARAGLYLADAAVVAGDLDVASMLVDVCDRTRRAAGIERDAPGEPGEMARRTLADHEGYAGTRGASDHLSLEMVVDQLESRGSS
jgi:ATP/maltotriose-dependent transcriptional regulator MalT